MATVRKREWTHKGLKKTAWVVDYIDNGGVRRLRTEKTKKEADRLRWQIEADVASGDHIAASEAMTMAELCNEFLRHSDQRLRDGLIGRNRRMQLDQTIRHHILPHLGAKLVSELTLIDIEHWYGKISPSAALASRSIYVEVLKRIEEFAFRRGFTKKRPVRDFKTERGSARREVIKTFTVPQVGAILAAAEVRQPKHTRRMHLLVKCVVHLAAFCGLRRGEIFGITLGALDLDGGLLRIRHSLTVFNELKGPKTPAGNRDVPLPAHVVDMLRDWLKHEYLPNERKLVFTSRSGSQASFTSSFHESWVKLLASAGIQDVKERGYHFHALRHFAASWALEMGMSPPDVASLLGHRTFDMTLQVYAHPVYDQSHRKTLMDASASRLMAATSAERDNPRHAELIPLNLQ